jgi:hypothetical protein
MLIPITSGMASAAVVSFTTGAVSDFQLSPGSAAAEVTFTNTGTYTGSGNVQGFSGNWITPTSAAGNSYEIRMTVNSGSTPTGSATASWLALGTTRTWDLSQSGVGATTGNVTVEIRNASTLAVLSSGGGAFDMTATVVS